MTPKKIK